MDCCLKLSEVIKADSRKFQMIDTRSQQQFSGKHFAGSLNITFLWLADNITTISNAAHILLIREYKTK